MKKLLFLLFIYSSCLAAEPSLARQTELQNLLKNDCGACHGLLLQGGLGSPLQPKDLAQKSDEFLIDTITNGRKGTAMPPWKPFMTQDEITWLVSLLRNPIK
ncbi:MAG: cytochrome c [Methylococcales bacterium]|nr:cytochrome c [Methylococcales bacterium]MDD5755612.1 cytochrome c [Methylococcales bacterium]